MQLYAELAVLNCNRAVGLSRLRHRDGDLTTSQKIGFIPAIVSVFLLEMVGEKKAKSLLLSGRILEMPEALALGLVTEVVGEGQLMNRVEEMAALLMKNSPESMGAVKKLLCSFAKDRLDRDLARAMRAGWRNDAKRRCTSRFRSATGPDGAAEGPGGRRGRLDDAPG